MIGIGAGPGIGAVKHKRKKARNTGDRKAALKARMPEKFRAIIEEAEKTQEGREALRRFRLFWGVPWPSTITVLRTPGGVEKKFRVGLGRSPAVYLADGPQDRHRKKKTLRGKRIIASDAEGKQIFIFSGKDSKNSKRKLRHVGFAPSSDYIPPRGIEKSGSHKSNRWWVHDHGIKEGGNWPRVFQDNAGNFVYERGGNKKASGKATYEINSWIEK
jgi:hypothetical protein